MQAAQPFRVLVVCIGNVCRSPLAQGLLVRAAKDRGLPLVTDSAGVEARGGAEMDSLTQRELQDRGIDPTGFRARPLAPRDLADADVILTATLAIRASALQLHPAAVRRAFTITEAAALADPAVVPVTDTGLACWVEEAARHRMAANQITYDIPDPRGARRRTHRQVAHLIEQAVDDLVGGWSQWDAQPESSRLGIEA